MAGTVASPASVSTASLTFPSATVGTTSAAQTVTLTHHLSTSLSVSPPVATGDFAVTSTTCGSSLGAGRSCTVGITFTPTVVGARTGTLTLAYRALSSPSVVALSGSGNANGLISITVTPANPSIAAGTTQQFTATGLFRGGSTQQLAAVTWSSSDRSLVEISNGATNCGRRLATASGTVTLTDAAGSVSGSATLTVSPTGFVDTRSLRTGRKSRAPCTAPPSPF